MSVMRFFKKIGPCLPFLNNCYLDTRAAHPQSQYVEALIETASKEKQFVQPLMTLVEEQLLYHKVCCLPSPVNSHKASPKFFS